MNDDEKNLQYASIGIASAGLAVAGLALGMIARRPGIGAVLGAAVGLLWRSRAIASRIRS